MEDLGEGEVISQVALSIRASLSPSCFMGRLIALVFWMNGAQGYWAGQMPLSLSRPSPSGLGVPLSVPNAILAPSPWEPQCSVSGKLSLGEVPKVPTQNPEGRGLRWSKLNFLSI